ncbi:hypothetical protein BCR42DRAFT_164311 [Absidia repens]|uniref:PH domain-containing protein n=1 Tax=Absidia repens TaxID=90262 RepID=A0A1X2ITT4_9FUNG|nr:hypothetical protein BCR42DRAFT_164311 [Absidia repens]
MAASLSSSNPQFLNNDNPAPRPSLSESALPSRRIFLRTNNRSTSTNSSMTTSSTGVRPSRFVKPTPSSSNSISTSINNNDMESFVSLFEEYSQKVYMEGYLMHQDKKYFVELCGTTLALWDIDRPGTVVTPDYIPIMVDTKAYATLRQQFTLELLHKKKVMVFDTLDPASLTKWICAVHLACFERQLLNQYFTLHLFSFPGVNKSTTTATSSSGYLQVLLPNNKNEWKKLWVVVSGTNSNNDSKKSKNVCKHEPHLTILESKKSKNPLLELKQVDHAYAVYPESASLISQSTLVRLEGVQQDNQSVDILLMADSNNHMTQWLSSLYNAFKLYGRPHAMVQDPMDPVALNFGEMLPGNVNEVALTQHWWLETDDVIQDIDVFASKNKTEIHQSLINAIQQKQASPSPLQQQPSTLQQQQNSYSQQRANSLPLITVESMDPPRQRATSDAGILNDSSIRPALHSQVADSSDESDGDLGEDDEDDEEEADSDDEPIGKSKPMTSQQSSSKKAVSSLLIPDFDFGNGFDTDRRRRESTAGSMLLSGGSSPTTSDIISRPSSRHHHHQEQPTSAQKSISSTSSSSGNSDKVNKKSAPAPGSASSLFGDFSLTTDFNKYLDPATSRTSTQDRKYSLPANAKLYNGDNTSAPTSNSSGLDRRSSSWDDYRMGWDDQSPRGSSGRRYMNEDCIFQDGDDENDGEKTGDDDTDDLDYEQDGPLIPSLNDHFAPRNSLLDSHAGEQLSAKEQIEYARATGQPLIQMPSKPRPPKGGLVGVISQREKIGVKEKGHVSQNV